MCVRQWNIVVVLFKLYYVVFYDATIIMLNKDFHYHCAVISMRAHLMLYF